MMRLMVVSALLIASGCDKSSSVADGEGEDSGVMIDTRLETLSNEEVDDQAQEEQPLKLGASPTALKPSVLITDRSQYGFVTIRGRAGKIDVRGVLPNTLIDDPDDPSQQILIPEKWQPVARPVPDRAGYVFSPFNNKLVDVRGLLPGTLVADPNYPASEKKRFRVPSPDKVEE